MTLFDARAPREDLRWPTRARSMVGGVCWADVEAAFEGWEVLSAEPAEPLALGGF